MKRLSGLWQNPNFLRLWGSETISLFGSQITLLALPLTAVLLLKASPFEMGLLSSLQFLPFLVLSLFAGVWVDRLPRRPILIIANIGRAILLGSIPLATMGGWLSMPLLYIIGTLVGVLTVFFDVAYQSYLPALVGRDHLVEGNSKLEASRSIAQISGPALAGMLVERLTAPFTIAVDAISFLFSALLLSRIPSIEQVQQPTTRPAIWKEIGEGLRIVLGNPVLRAIAGCTSTLNFFANLWGAMLTLYVVQQLGMSPATLGFILGVGSVGALFGALLSATVVRRFGVGTTIIATTAIGAIGSLSLPLARGNDLVAMSILMLGQCIISLSMPIYNVTQVSLRQSITPERLQGRMNASMRFLVWGVMPLGSMAGGLLGERFGVYLPILIGALGEQLAILWLLFSPLRHLREHPQPNDEAEALLSATSAPLET